MSAARSVGEGSPPREICIVMLSAIGDAVHVLPVASALKRTWPDTRITWVIQPVPWTLVRDHSAVDDFIVYPRRRGVRSWTGFHEVMGRLRNRRFDLVLGLQVYFKAGLITALVPARVKLGFDRARARDAQWLFTNARIPARHEAHVQDQYFEFLHHLGVEPEPLTWGLHLTDGERAAQEAWFGAPRRPTCAVVVSTSKPAKNWSVEGYARVLEHVESRHGLHPVIVGGPSEDERRTAQRVAKLTGADVSIELGDDLRRLLWLVEGSELLLSPDTGPLHVARAVGTPVVGLYGHTNPKRSGPYRAYHELVVDGYATYPGEDYPLTAKRRDGMSRIGVQDVTTKVDLAVERYVGTTAERRDDARKAPEAEARP